MAPSLKIKPAELSLEDEIAARLGDFDLIALLRLLTSEGFKADDIWFSSHNSIASHNRVIESVVLRENCAFIQLNLGLLASTGFLPGHIRQFMERPEVNDQALQTFFQFFDHLLITSYLGQLYPEINKSFFDHWPQTKKCYTELQNMRSECSLHWLFECTFPEFFISITRVPGRHQGRAGLQTLGKMILGEGGQSSKPSGPSKSDQFQVYLIQRPEWGRDAQNWPPHIRKRLNEWVFPWLNTLLMSLDIYLCIYRNGSHLKLYDQSALGYDALYNQGDIFVKKEKFAPLQCFAIHRGSVPSPLVDSHVASSSDVHSSRVNSSDKTLLSAQENEPGILWEGSCRLQL
ncbi:MAG: hypothetical protein V4660_05405 [Pseudomonadota bacterium]